MNAAERSMESVWSLLRVIGSLRVAAFLLLLICISMAGATVFESSHGTENALSFFYLSWWFQTLLGLLAVNAAAGLIMRYPFSRHQIGFAMTHGAILLVLAGALITRRFGIDGKMAITEGQAVEEYTLAQDSLRLISQSSATSIDIHPPSALHTGAVDFAAPASLVSEKVTAEVLRYTLDSIVEEEMMNDSPHARLAIEVSFSATGTDQPVWIQAGQSARVGEADIMCRQADSEEQFKKLAATAPASQPASKGTVKIEHQGKSYDLEVEDCIAATQPVGDTGMTLRVLRYLPHAVVAAKGRLDNASEKPVNPAIEVELGGPRGVEKRFAFARFPDFQSMHGGHTAPETKIILAAAFDEDVHAPIEVICGPGDTLHVRFSNSLETILKSLQIGEPVASPWPDRKLTVLRVFRNARIRQTVLPSSQPTVEQTPAILVRLTSGNEKTELWIQKYRGQQAAFAGQTYALVYGDKSTTLGFKVALDSFSVDNYPGSNRPRSYQSKITITDPVTGRRDPRVVSMNRPTSFGGYTFYQSSYHQDRRGMTSVLSVSWDPGQPIVFAGYGLMIVGMLVVLITRLRSKTTSPEHDENPVH